MKLALFQPEIAGNVGTILRMAACFGVPVDIIEPCGFAFSDRSLRRAGMDYAAAAAVTRFTDWPSFTAAADGRLVLLSTAGDSLLHQFEFAARDTIVMGSESRGAPPEVHADCAARVRIALRPGFRSLNVALAAGIAVAEALRQTGGYAP